MTVRRRAGDDRGTSLTLALVLITVFAIVIGAVLTFADGSLRTTTVLRQQQSEVAGADGAGEIAVNAIRQGSYDGSSGGCFPSATGSSDTLTLPDVHRSATGPADSAAVTCELDTAHSAYSPVAISDANNPRNAILTLGDTSAGEDGLGVDVAGAGTLKVHGSVYSHSNVAVTQGALTTDASLRARGACTGTISATPPPACSLSTVDSTGDDPLYPAPAGTPVAQTHPTCDLAAANVLIEFEPGLYTDAGTLTLLTRCPNVIIHFKPGVYYFDFPSSNSQWRIAGASVVAGTPTTPLVAGTPPTMPGSCQSPVPPMPADPTWRAPDPNAGVTFVFGGASRLLLRDTRAEICGSYSATAPPIVMYGLRTAIGVVPAQSDCTLDRPYPATGCAVFKTDGTTDSQLYVQGTVYLPQSAVEVAPGNPVAPVFYGGVIARTLRITPLAGAGLANPAVVLPDNIPLGRRTTLLLTVYLCPGAPTCSPATGQLRLRAKLGVLDPTATALPGARQLTIYSWSAQR